MKRYSRGFTVIELLAVLAVAGVIYTVVAPRIKEMFVGSRLSTEETHQDILTTQIREFYGTAGSYTGLTSAVALSNNIVPQYMISGTNVISEWGTIALGTASGNTEFTLQYNLVPKAYCAKFAADNLANYDKITVGATVVTTPSGAATACTAATSTVTFTHS
jgi:prepilin-type N-terminal cleavage/methylation domain-containing protein